MVGALAASKFTFNSRFFTVCHIIFYIHCVIKTCSILRLGGVIDSGGSSDSLNELGWNAVGASVIIVYYAVSSIVLFLFIERIGWYRYGTVLPDSRI